MELNRQSIQELANQQMLQLAGDPRFQAFMQLVSEQREVAIADLCNDAVVADVNKICAAIGEIRAHNAYLDAYREARNKLPQERGE